MRNLFIVLLLLPALSWSQRVYLMGDAGEPRPNDPNLSLFKSETESGTADDVLIFLGDNIYPKGLPNKEDPERAEMEAKLNPQLEIMKSFKGKSYMIPGNHDWAQGRNYGWERILNMQLYVNEYLEREDAFLPLGGCPGPVEIQLSEITTLIIVDSQYYLHPWDKPDEDDGCEYKSTIESLNELRSVIQKNRHKHILLAAHHPMFTYGEHNGNFPFKAHLLPPVLGSIHPFFRKAIGNIQDNTHPKYKAIMKEVLSAMNESSQVVMASGHDHTLQLINKEGHHFIVSGSGSKATHLKPGKATFGKSERGFAIVDFQESGSADVKYLGEEGGVLYEGELYQKNVSMPSVASQNISFQGQKVTVRASEKYIAGKGKRYWLGGNYRDVWETEVEVPVFDLGVERGGLKVLKKGGGMQTKSLRLEAEDGKQYVLRSIEKYPENAMPAALRKTFAQEIVQDQISSSHPYGAFIVPRLADAAQIYHTNPQPVFIPDDPRLGQFQPTFAGTLAVYEERPNKEAASEPFFGGGDRVRGTLDVIEKLKKDNDNTVDQKFVVRNRLFDMWIGDWDRHDDQWRWAEFEREVKGKLYRPIPRDRDQAFFVNEGVIPKIASRKWALPKIEGFDESVRWAPGISQNARFFDRSFMNEPDWNDWQEQIKFLQSNLTDEVIAEAVALWPEQIQELTAERVTKGLKARRADLPRFAREHYEFLSKNVEVVGTNKHEYFKVERPNENETKVTVFKRKKDGEIQNKIYERTFLSTETKEVRLYGLDGEDIFELNGASGRTKVRIIGGTDKDRIINKEGESRLKNVLVYDRLKSTKFDGNEKGIKRLSSDPAVNAYDRKAFTYDVLMPQVSINVNPDDGIFLGGGFVYTKHGWRKEPYAAKHSFSANAAFKTGSFNINYKGDYTNVFRKWSLKPTFLWQEPFFVGNYFGLGNETVFIQDEVALGVEDPIEYYRTRMDHVEFDLDLNRRIGEKANFYFGPGYREMRVEPVANRFITDAVDPSVNFEDNVYWKIKVGINVDTRDSPVLPQRGSMAMAEVTRYFARESFSSSFTRYAAEWAFLFSARLPSRLVIGNRVGFAHNDGDFEFFNANTLGGWTNLRGFRRTRFFGKTSFYHNLDLRLKLFSFRSYIFPGQFGLIAFHDVGRVWIDGENSNTWHTGKGGGIWFSPLNSTVVTVQYSFGEDENLPFVRFGFYF